MYIYCANRNQRNNNSNTTLVYQKALLLTFESPNNLNEISTHTHTNSKGYFVVKNLNLNTSFKDLGYKNIN